MNKHAMDIRIKLPNSSQTVTTEGLLSIDETNLSGEFAAQAAIYAYFRTLLVTARYDRDVAKDAMEQEQAQAFVEFKTDPELVPTGGRTVSDDLANKYVTCDEKCMRAKKLYIQHELEFRQLETLVRALEMRANMLISMGAQLRSEAEMDGMHINENPGDDMRRTMEKRRRS